MLGGGFVSNMAKHSAINEANRVAKLVQRDLKTFKKELSDVNEFTSIQVNLSSFASFAIFNKASINSSKVSLLSVSVGSIIIASLIIRGK